MDFIVNLIEPTSGDAVFYAQVKATNGKYIGTGRGRRLNVKLSRKDRAKLSILEGGAMNETENKFIVSRAETLAREFLTRRPDVVIHPFDDHDLHLSSRFPPPRA